MNTYSKVLGVNIDYKIRGSTMITYKDEKSDRLGDIIVIYKDGYPIGNLSQIGRGQHPDILLRASRLENSIAFPMVSLAEITKQDIENIVTKYLS